MKTVLFWDRCLNERGTSVATFDYADYNERILGNKSIVVGLNGSWRYSEQRFRDRFDLHMVDGLQDVQRVYDEMGCDCMYVQKSGEWDGLVLERGRNLIHVVFPHSEPHGDVYAYISEWLADTMRPGAPWVPYMVNLPKHDRSMRGALGLPVSSFVFGWYGGNNFNISFAREAVINSARIRRDAYFLFMNQDAFCEEENILFLPRTTDPAAKVQFINTCDAMVHARNQGETFGLAIAEFSLMNKPVITYDFHSPIDTEPELAHIHMLGDAGIYYRDKQGLTDILVTLTHDNVAGRNWNRYGEFTPEAVMARFDEVFLR